MTVSLRIRSKPSDHNTSRHNTSDRGIRPQSLSERVPKTSDTRGRIPRVNAESPASAIVRPSELTIVVIDRRVLIRECLVRCLKLAAENCIVQGFSNVAEWQEAAGNCPPAVVILCAADGEDGDAERDLTYLSQEAVNVPVVVVSDGENVDQILAALEGGARGYIPTSMPLDVAVKAMRLVEAGGTFVPASSIFSSRRREEGAAEDTLQADQFTARQAAVLEALRQGKANKQIAYELNMREGTVKVHVRNIMKKLKARNRTEVAFLMNGRASGVSDH